MPSRPIRIIEIFATIFACAVFLRWSYRRNYSECKANAYEFDPGRIQGAFEPHARRYQATAKLVDISCRVGGVSESSSQTSTSASQGVPTVFDWNVAPSATVFVPERMLLLAIPIAAKNIYYEQYTHVVYPTKEVSHQSRRLIQTSGMQPA